MKILIINVHSALNLGDDAIMKVTIEGLEKKFPQCEITVAANDPESWRKYQGINIVNSLCSWAADCRTGQFMKALFLTPIYLPLLFIFAATFRLFGRQPVLGDSEKRRLLLAYYQADLILSCGGGNYYAHKPLSPGFLWTLFNAYFAIFLGKRLIMLPQSIGPIEGHLQRFLTRRLLYKVDKIMLREQISFDFLIDTLGIDGRKMRLFDDLAFALSPTPTSKGQGNRKDNRLSIGITLMDRHAQDPGFLNQAAYEDALESVVFDLAQRKDARIFLFVQCYGPSDSQDDRLITQRLYRLWSEKVENLILLDTYNTAQVMRDEYGEMDMVIGTRMHTGVFALSRGVPLILIGYQPKAQGMMSAFQLDNYYLPIEDVERAVLSESVEKLMKEMKEIRLQIIQSYQDISQSSERWLDSIEI